jgi:uncharacterized repeat protein (TIGR01451 family)
LNAPLGWNSHRRTPLAALAAVTLLGFLLAAALAPSAEARIEGFQGLAPSPTELTAVASDPSNGLIYAQADGGTAFFVYDPRTNAWSERAPSPLNSGNNGGAAYLGGKIYVSYTQADAEIAVYDIAGNSWTTIANPLGAGTGAITSGNGKLYMAEGLKFVSYDPSSGIVSPLAEPPKFPDSEGDPGIEAWGGLQFAGDKIYSHQGNGYTGFAVYDIGSNSWQELPYAPEPEEEEGPVLGSALNPVTNTYLTYGPYSGKQLYRFDIEAGSWSTAPTMPFIVEDGGMAYVSQPGIEGVYMVEGEGGTGFVRYDEANETDLAPSMSTKVAKGGKITYSIQVKNNGPERASGVVLSNLLQTRTTLVSATASQGSCTGTTALSCNLGVLRSGATASLTIQVKSRRRNAINTVTVSSRAVDTNPGNDGVWTLTKQCVVPKLRKRGLKGAKKALRKANCKPGKVSRRHSGKIDERKVIRSSKNRGKVLPAGSKVRLVVSDGPKGAS